MSPVLGAIFFAAGIGILLLWFVPRISGPLIQRPPGTPSFRERLQQNLHLAGLVDSAPIFVIIGLAMGSATLAMVLYLFLKSPFVVILAPIVVIGGFSFFLRNRQQSFLRRATDELIPFFNRVATSVKAGRPAPQAYVDAVLESLLLRELLEDSASNIAAGMRFSDALLDTRSKVPLRMWTLFVRQMELHDRMGGDLGLALETTISQINEMLQLQAEALADYTAQKRQQQIIFYLPFVGIAAFALLVPGGMDLMSALWTTVPGIVMGLIGIGIMAAGRWFGRKQLIEIERKLSF